VKKVETAGGPLAGVRVVDLTRLAPGPYCTMLLADLGADVIVVGGGRSGTPVPELSRGKRFISLDLKSANGQAALRRLCDSADVLVEGFRPGVAARIGAGAQELQRSNPRLVYCSLTGFGQTGPRAQTAGHDINYLSLSGVMGAIGPADRQPHAPLNLLADFASGSMLAAFGIASALIERARTGKGQTVDAAMLDGCISMMAMHYPLWRSAHMPGRGEGLLSGSAPFYRTYTCADGRFIAVGALEKGFFDVLWLALELGDVPDHMARANWPAIEKALQERFLARDRDHWSQLFASLDACVTPVLEPSEVWLDPQVQSRLPDAQNQVPVVPRFGGSVRRAPDVDTRDQTAEVLAEFGFSPTEIDEIKPSTVEQTGLSWPPELR